MFIKWLKQLQGIIIYSLEDRVQKKKTILNSDVKQCSTFWNIISWNVYVIVLNNILGIWKHITEKFSHKNANELKKNKTTNNQRAFNVMPWLRKSRKEQFPTTDFLEFIIVETFS